MALPITERSASEMTGTDLFYTVVRRADDEYGDPYYVRLASLMAFLGGQSDFGDVDGPATSTDNAVARFHKATGKVLQNSVVIISDTGAVSGVTSLAMGGALSGVTSLAMGGALTGGTSGSFTGAVTVDDLLLYDLDASHTLTLRWNESEAAANRRLYFKVEGANRIITLVGSPDLGDWFDQSVKEAANVIFATLTVNNSGIHILDTGGDHDLILAVGEDLGADRVLTITLGDAARTITFSGNPTLDDWFNQNTKTTASPTFDDLKLYDTNASHTVTLHWNEDEAAANRALNFVLGGADRTIMLSGDVILPTLDGTIAEIDGIDSDGGVFPFDTTGTVTFNQTVVASNGAIQIGVNDTQMAWLTLYGHDTGSVNGGRIYLYTALDHHGVVNNYYVQVSSDLFQIGDNAGGVRFTLNTLGNIVCTGSVTMDDLLLYDTNASHYLTIHWDEDEAAANRALNLVLNGANRSIDLAMDFTLPADPGADRIFFWDDGAGATAWLAATSGIEIDGTDLKVDVDGLDEIGAALVDADTIIVDDGDSGTTKKSLMSRVATYVGGGAGDVVGPAGATDHAYSRFDTATGKLLQDSLSIEDDAGIVTHSGQSSARAYLAGDQTLTTGTNSRVQLVTESWDVQNEFIPYNGGDPTNTGRFVATVAGKYPVACCGYFQNVADGKYGRIYVFVNGTAIAITEAYSSGSLNDPRPTLSEILDLEANDYVEFWAQHNDGGDTLLKSATNQTWFSIGKMM